MGMLDLFSSDRVFRLSATGGDRATAYTMSNKIVELGRYKVFTWLSAQREIIFALYESKTSRVVHESRFAEGVDNHCGAAITRGVEGTLVAVSGGHHSPFYFRRAQIRDGALFWSERQVIAEDATYPSLVGDEAGHLHCCYRHKRRSAGRTQLDLGYVRAEGGVWEEPITLIHAGRPGYIYWTNALATGPTDTLHLIAGVSLNDAGGGRTQGAAHLFSRDHGRTWQQYGQARASAPPLEAGELQRLDHELPDLATSIIPEQVANTSPGPASVEYTQLNLSNMVEDADDRPWFVYHHVPDGAAWLCHHDGGRWHAEALAPMVRAGDEGLRIHPQSTISRRSDGTIDIVLMVQSTRRWQWGAPATSLLHLIRHDRGEVKAVAHAPATDAACWLPALQHWDWRHPSTSGGLLWTVGRNAGGFTHNTNELETHVLCCPALSALPGIPPFARGLAQDGC